jgi:extracellular elastinolytic metalloproteinase
MRDRHVLALVVGALLVLPATAGAVSRATPTGPDAAKPYFDSRTGDRGLAARAGAPVAAARPTERTRQARAGLRRTVGSGAVLNVDPLTGTPRQLLRTDGALSGPRGGDRVDIALDFARANRETLGLDASDLDELDAKRGPTSSLGLTVVHFRQLYRGIPAFDNDLRVAVDRAGRVLSVAGAPRQDLSVPSIEPSLDGAEALARLQRDVGVERSLPLRSGPAGARQITTFKGGDFARLVLFGAADGAKLAWHVTYRATSAAFYDAVVDAKSGAILYRQNLTKADGLADVYPNHPDAGPAQSVDLQSFGLPANSTTLDGDFSRQWADLDDDNTVDAGEETTPLPGTDFNHPFTAFSPAAGGCTTAEPCAWDSTSTGTRAATKTTNRLQDGVQAFYLVSRFHDHLERPAIGFDRASGNFEVDSAAPLQSDPVLTQTDDGAATGPDGDHLNNANMSTPPDGNPPTMQMYLFRRQTGFVVRSINGGDDSGIVWHEYTHGLSNRLVTNADGTGALSSAHSGAMGEGWSDWYASDLQVREGFKTDDPATPNEIDIGDYSDATPHTLRSQALDCPVGEDGTLCPGGFDTATGGYTLGDFGKVFGTPEVHADGEIWAETLWDLRQAVGSDVAETLVTNGMRLSPPEPSMLDMRNAILAAEQANGGGLHDEVWEVFRKRGMGYLAAASDGADTKPVEDFTSPPSPTAAKGTAAGVVTDDLTGLPLAGARVTFGGDAPLVDATDASGRYTIPNVPAGTYPKLTFPATGYDTAVVPDVVITGNGTTTHNIALDRNWASLAAGAVADASDDTAAPACGVAQGFDQYQGTVWSAENRDGTGPETDPPTVTITLPETVDVTAFLIDPTAGCGDDPSASTGEYRVETSTNGSTFRTAVDGTGANGFTSSDLNQFNRRNPGGTSGDDTNYVRITLLNPQDEDAACVCAGADFIDLSEFQVLGTVPNTLPSGSLGVSNANPAPNEVITFDATAVTDQDSAITGYDWDFDANGTVDRSTRTPTTDFAYSAVGRFNPVVRAKDFRGGAGTATTTVTVATIAPGPAGPPPPAGPGPAPLAPLPSLSVSKRGTGGLIRPSVRCALRCSVRAKLVVSRATARKLKLKKRTLATFKRTLTTTQRKHLRLRIPAKVRRAAKRAGLKTIRATLTIKATYAGGRSKTAHKVVRIRL